MQPLFEGMSFDQKIDKIKKLISENQIPYRQGVVAIIKNSSNQYLLVQNNSFKENEWKFPTGGRKDGETDIQTLEREIEEEIGTRKFKVLKESTIKSRHEWKPIDILRKLEQNNIFYRGQEQSQFLVEFTGSDDDIKIDPEEIRKYLWSTKDDLSKYLIFHGQLDLALETLEELEK